MTILSSQWKKEQYPTKIKVVLEHLDFVVGQSDVIGGQDLHDRLGRRFESLAVLLDDDGKRQAEAVGVVVLRTAGWPRQTQIKDSWKFWSLSHLKVR